MSEIGGKVFIENDVGAGKESPGGGDEDEPTGLVDRESNEDATYASLDDGLGVQNAFARVCSAASINFHDAWASEDTETMKVGLAAEIKFVRGRGSVNTIGVSVGKSGER